MSSGQHKHFTGCRAAEQSFADSHGRKKKSPVTNVLACEWKMCVCVGGCVCKSTTFKSFTAKRPAVGGSYLAVGVRLPLLRLLA